MPPPSTPTPTPQWMYGTAWKEDETKRLVGLALAEGFRAIDTANQRKHYHEVGVGEALAEAYAGGLVRREDLFLQTKFTHQPGQDDRLPYDPRATVARQVEQSFASSLEHLRTTWIDSYVLHGPSVRRGLAPEDVEAWEAMEAIARTNNARVLGVSNVTAEQLGVLLERATVKPMFVQNRCYASAGWDREVRAICREHGVVYQGFSLLTANRREIASRSFVGLAERLGLRPSQLVFRFAIDVGMLPLTGTTSAEHMREDLAVTDLPPLSRDDVHAIDRISG